MNRHQVLTGACNIGEKCHAVGSVEGIHFTVRYLTDLVISFSLSEADVSTSHLSEDLRDLNDNHF
jgi:hypothetical protein